MISARLLDYPKISELLASLILQKTKYEVLRPYIRTNACIRPYAYTLPHCLYIQSNACIRPYVCTVPHLSYTYDLTSTYSLTRTYGLPILRSSNLLYLCLYFRSPCPSNLLIIRWLCSSLEQRIPRH